MARRGGDDYHTIHHTRYHNITQLFRGSIHVNKNTVERSAETFTRNSEIIQNAMNINNVSYLFLT
eukprot:scaffold1007_cov176-Amphora_coffeaeformis.AAC.37